MRLVHAAANGRYLVLGSVPHRVDVGERGTEPVKGPGNEVAVLGDAVAHRGVRDLQQNGAAGPREQNAFRSDVGQVAHHGHTIPTIFTTGYVGGWLSSRLAGG